MADGHGGHRTPRKPAPVSGPGKFSKRTDGKPQPRADLPNAGYGEQAAYQEAQAGAPMASASATPSPGGGSAPGAPAAGPPAAATPVEVTPFGAESMRPDEPVTHGADAGEGPGLASLGLQDPAQRLSDQDLQRLRAELSYLEWMASLPNAAPTTRAYVRKIKGMLP